MATVYLARPPGPSTIPTSSPFISSSNTTAFRTLGTYVPGTERVRAVARLAGTEQLNVWAGLALYLVSPAALFAYLQMSLNDGGAQRT
jgi:hypothetical protein